MTTLTRQMVSSENVYLRYLNSLVLLGGSVVLLHDLLVQVLKGLPEKVLD